MNIGSFFKTDKVVVTISPVLELNSLKIDQIKDAHLR